MRKRRKQARSAGAGCAGAVGWNGGLAPAAASPFRCLLRIPALLQRLRSHPRACHERSGKQGGSSRPRAFPLQAGAALRGIHPSFSSASKRARPNSRTPRLRRVATLLSVTARTGVGMHGMLLIDDVNS